MKKTENKFVYYLGKSMYINITNLCTNKCAFCIRSSGDEVGGVNLILENEKFTSADIIEEVKAGMTESCPEIIFCGYGEPLIKLDIVKEVAAFIKENYPEKLVRINTNGQANLIHKKNVAPELVGLIDKISVSLNADNADLYKELCCSSFEKEAAYQGVTDFIAECVKAGIDTTASVVSGFDDFDIDIEKCRKITEELGAEFRVREWLPEGYDN